MGKRLNDIITTVIPQEHQWKLTILREWPTLIGDMHHHISIHTIQNDILILQAAHPAWAQELSFLTGILKKKINALFPQEYIKTIRFQVGTIKKKTQVAQAAPSSLKKPAPRELTNHEKACLSRVKDQELQQILSDFLRVCSQKESP